MILSILLFIFGLGLLIAGGESLVRGASSIAKKLGVKPIVIGLTVVAFGTSMPELVVNIFSAINNTPDIAIGNVIGSNIANILLILGICALIAPLKVQKNTTWKEIPFALLAVTLIFIMGNDIFFNGGTQNILTRSEGLSLIAFFIIFLYYTFGIAKKQGEAEEPSSSKTYTWILSLLFTLGGLGLLIGGGKLLVDSAITLATLAGLSEALIGLTIVAVGTSLPELITSIIAVRHKQDDIAIGNIVGSNIFNVFWILGFTATLRPLPLIAGASFDILVSMVATLLLFGFMFIHSKHTLNRWQGSVFIFIYAGYVSFLIFRG